MIRIVSRAAVAAMLVAASAAPVLAHATLQVGEAAIGSTYRAVLQVPHGCGTEATNVVRVQIPEGFYNVKPMPKAGWELETVVGPYANTYDNHGTAMTEGVVEIVWSGGELPNEWYDEFVFRGTFADTLPEGPISFPAIQECASAEEAWIGEDAPTVTLVSAEGGIGH